MTTSPVAAVPFASNHWALMVPGPPSVITRQRLVASQPMPNTVPFEARSCVHFGERYGPNQAACVLPGEPGVNVNVPAAITPPPAAIVTPGLPCMLLVVFWSLPSEFQASNGK